AEGEVAALAAVVALAVVVAALAVGAESALAAPAPRLAAVVSRYAPWDGGAGICGGFGGWGSPAGCAPISQGGSAS
ncbi:hypothetical protein, partial [Mycobacterium kiyosense]|uniref:hypothetical protein n=1 Tax=Mycobacterium kiyosense TaxID=2871094 RepID=UPI0022320473